MKSFTVVVLAMLLGGCAALLPKATNELRGAWGDFDDAKRAIEAIRPYATTRADLQAAGIDPYTNPAITILTYSDVLQRFAAGPVIAREQLESGVRDCIAAGRACTGFAISQRTVRRNRIGSFWLDSFAFRREVDVTGWSFNALVLLVDEKVVYTLFGGQPKIHEVEITRNPLGPLQGWGDQVGPTLLGPR